MSEVVSEFPLYLSPSQVSSLGTCGEQFRLTRLLKVPERPQWAGIGGSAVHRMTEDIDRALMGEDVEVHPWDFYWNEALDAEKGRHPEFAEDEYYTGGRASKEWPNKETPEWWAQKGPGFVKSWVKWLELSGLRIWEYPDADGVLRPAIELETMADRHWYDDAAADPSEPYDSLYVKSIIDRVLVDDDDTLYIVDIKSGSYTAAWPQQMALNNLGLSHTIGVKAHKAGFWKARQGGVPEWFDLSVYSDEWLWQQVANAKQIRDQHLFVAQPNNLCKSACGVAKYCRAMGGDPSFFETDATVTHERQAQ